MTMAATQDDKLVVLGVITAPHGIRGAVKIKSYTEVPDSIGDYDSLTDPASGRSYRIRIIGQSKGLLMAEIDGATSRNDAEALRRVELAVPRSLLPAHDDADAFFITDLIGLPVTLEDGSNYGTVKDVHNFGAGDILEIATGGTTEMVLFTKASFPDITQERLMFIPPEIE